MKKFSEIFIVRDNREKTGWFFNKEDKVPGKSQIVGTVIDTLDCGDYSIKGLEHIVRIERKAGFSELLGNMIPVGNKERFEREMEKLSQIPFKYILIETNLSNDLLCSSVPQIKTGITYNAVLKWLFEIEIKYGVKFLFVGDAGKKVMRDIFDMVVKNYDNI